MYNLYVSIRVSVAPTVSRQLSFLVIVHYKNPLLTTVYCVIFSLLHARNALARDTVQKEEETSVCVCVLCFVPRA